MKIFNWVHRKFHHSVDYTTVPHNKKDGFPENYKNPETVTKDTDTEALLNHVPQVDVLDGWREGILTIGTFGFDPLKFPIEYSVKEIEEQEYSVTEEEEEDDDDDDDNVEGEKEVNPLVVKSFTHELDKGIVLNTNTVADPKATGDGIPLIRYLESSRLKPDSDNNENDGDKKKGERITLADLFSADKSVSDKSDAGAIPSNSLKKGAFRKKHGFSFAKKLIPRKGEDTRPMEKLQQLITRLVKRKIHPELEGKIHKSDGSVVVASKTKKDKNSIVAGRISYGSRSSSGGRAHEAVSLLQDAVAAGVLVGYEQSSY